MANYLDTNPSDRPMLDWHRADPFGLVPIVRKGELAAMVNPCALDRHIPAAPVTIEDYVVGLEVLGFRFAVDRHSNGPVGIVTVFPRRGCPKTGEAWLTPSCTPSTAKRGMTNWPPTSWPATGRSSDAPRALSKLPTPRRS